MQVKSMVKGCHTQYLEWYRQTVPCIHHAIRCLNEEDFHRITDHRMLWVEMDL